MKKAEDSAFLLRILDAPAYGFTRNGEFYRPSRDEIFREFFHRLNIFRSRKNWLPFFSWLSSLSFAIPLYIFLTQYFNFGILILGFIYSMVVLGTHGTIWLHRYCSHRAYEFRNPFFRFICRNLVLKIIPEETYAVSHLTHHSYSERPGDPYNVHGGWLYCFLADVNHQSMAKDLSEEDYKKLVAIIKHSGIKVNSYAQYQKWGSLAHPLNTIVHVILNWGFWYGVFYLLGGHALATGLFGMSGVWAFGVRTFNFDGHGRGKDLRQEGIDFHRRDLSINQVWPGYVAGEWHNNHHLYPNSARSGFLPYQLDLAWVFIWSWHKLGLVKNYRENKNDFYRDWYLPYLKEKESRKTTKTSEITQEA